MKTVLYFLCISVFLFSCGESTSPCDCLKTYEIRQTKGDSLQNAIDCLLASDVILDLNNEETGQLIYDMEGNCPVGSRKLWKLCAQIEAGKINY